MGEAPTCYLSTTQAAAVLGLSPRTLERYRVTGGGPPFLTYCNRVHYLRSDLDVWAIGGRRFSTSDDGGGEDGRRERGGRADRASRTAGARRGRPVPLARAEPEAQAPEEAARCAVASGNGSAHLSVRELAALLQVSRRTLDRYRAQGVGPAFENVDGRVLYARANVEAWLASSRRDSTFDAGEETSNKNRTDPDAGDDATEGA